MGKAVSWPTDWPQPLPACPGNPFKGLSLLTQKWDSNNYCWLLLFFFFFNFLLRFTYLFMWEEERESEQEKDGEIWSRLHAERSRISWGALSHNHKIMAWPETKCTKNRFFHMSNSIGEFRKYLISLIDLEQSSFKIQSSLVKGNSRQTRSRIIHTTQDYKNRTVNTIFSHFNNKGILIKIGKN